MKKYIINNNITLEYAKNKLDNWENLKFQYDMIDKMNILHKVNRYTQMVEILNERN